MRVWLQRDGRWWCGRRRWGRREHGGKAQTIIFKHEDLIITDELLI